MLINRNTILAPQPTVITVSLAPVYSILNSISGIAAVDSNPGIDNLLVRVNHALPPEILLLHKSIFLMMGIDALASAVEPLPESFPAFLEAFKAVAPSRIKQAMMESVMRNVNSKLNLVDEDVLFDEPDMTRLFEDRDYFISMVEPAVKKVDEDGDFYLLTFDLISNPAEMQNQAYGLLTDLWERFFEAEWARIEPTLKQSVDALQQIDTSGMPIFEAIRAITGRNLRGILAENELMKYPHIQFIPSRHNGPYITSILGQTTLHIVFGARIPAHLKQGSSALNNAELLNRLRAMGDDARMEILISLRQHGELSTSQIMDIFDLNKSAASRHLRNLRAAELIDERRDADGKGKFYHLSDEGIAEVLNTIKALLG